MELLKEVREMVFKHQEEQKTKAVVEYPKIVEQIKSVARLGERSMKIPKTDVNFFVCEVLKNDGFKISTERGDYDSTNKLSRVLSVNEYYVISW